MVMQSMNAVSCSQIFHDRECDAAKATGHAEISTSFERLIRIVFPRDTKARPGRYGPDTMAPRPRPAPAREA